MGTVPERASRLSVLVGKKLKPDPPQAASAARVVAAPGGPLVSHPPIHELFAALRVRGDAQRREEPLLRHRGCGGRRRSRRRVGAARAVDVRDDRGTTVDVRDDRQRAVAFALIRLRRGGKGCKWKSETHVQAAANRNPLPEHARTSAARPPASTRKNCVSAAPRAFSGTLRRRDMARARREMCPGGRRAGERAPRTDRKAGRSAVTEGMRDGEERWRRSQGDLSWWP